jgi:hypothetical protein
LPGKITLDEALASTTAAPEQPAASKRITFDEASQAIDATRAPAQFSQVPFFDAATGKEGTRPGLPVLPQGTELAPQQFDAGGKPLPAETILKPLPASQARFGTALKSEIPLDTQTRLRVIAEDLFPGDPKGIERVGIRNGKPVFVNDQGELQYVSSPLARGGASVIGASPEIAGSIIGSAVGSPAAGPAIGSIIGRGAKRAASALLLDEPVTTGGLAKELAIEGGINAVAGKGGQLLGKIAERGKFIDPRAYDAAALRQAEQLIRTVKAKTGVELDLAQATGNRYLLELRDYVAKYPGKTADVFQLRDDLAAGQFDTATNRVLDLVAQPVPRGIAGNNAVNAAQKVIGVARGEVSDAVRPLYDAAYAAVPQVTDPAILGFLKLPYFEEAFNKGQIIAQLDEVALPPGAAPDLRALDLTKQKLDDVIEGLKAGGNRNEARALEAKKKEFVALLDNYPNSQYQAARQAYAQGIAVKVAPLENGLVGTLARMSPQNAEKAARIFNDPRLPPEEIALLKASLSRLNPNAYKGLVREYLAKEYDNSVRVTQGAENVNQAGKFYQQLFGSPDRQKKLKALLPPDAFEAAEGLFLAAQKLAKTPLGSNRIAGSATESRGRIAEALGDRLSPVLDILTSSRQTIRQTGELIAREKGVDMIADALTDPAKRKLLKQAVKLTDAAKQRIVLTSILTGQSAVGVLKDITENAGLGQ